MRKSEIKAKFKSDIGTVWKVVTDNKNAQWRSDLEKIEIADENTFIEYPKQGNPTKFIITKKEKEKQYEFDMENKMFSGHWIGKFEKLSEGGCEITFIEEIQIKNKIIELISYIAMDLKKMQQTYMDDLKQKLGER